METILCTGCKTSKEKSKFYHNKDGKLIDKRCKECRKTTAKKNYYAKGGIETLRAWREANKEKYQAQHKRAKANQKAKVDADPVLAAKLRENKRLNSKKNFISGMIGRAKQRAIKYNIIFTISNADIIVPTHCPILNIPLILGTKGDYQSSPSIDRIDPSKGYIPSNIKVISTLANTMKNSATKEQLITFASNIEAYLQDMI